MKRSYESPETLNQRNREHRERMREKGFKYLCVWVSPDLKVKIMKIIDEWRSSNTH